MCVITADKLSRPHRLKPIPRTVHSRPPRPSYAPYLLSNDPPSSPHSHRPIYGGIDAEPDHVPPQVEPMDASTRLRVPSLQPCLRYHRGRPQRLSLAPLQRPGLGCRSLPPCLSSSAA